MRIGLIDLDRTDFPNIALMKLSSHHKEFGDDVEWYDPMFGGWYDIVYVSKVFSYSDDYPYEINADTVIYGGGGYSNEQLYLDTVMPDYSLYGIEDEAYGYLTRGCPNNCPYCVVPKLDGNSVRKVANLDMFWSGQKTINIMDANLLGLNNRAEVVDLFEQMIGSKAYINFVQGLDIRLMDDEIIDLLLRMKIKMIHFAWDDPRDKIIPQKLQHFWDRTGWDKRKVTVYVLTNFWSTKEEDLERIYTIRDIGFTPFDMVYDRHLLPRGHEVLRMQRWCNNKFVFRSVDRFEDYR